MRRRLATTFALTSLCVAAARPAPSSASRAASSVTRVAAPSLETAGKGLRVRAHTSVRYGEAPQRRAIAWTRFLSAAGSAWQASWDEATAVPSRIFGRGMPAPRAVSDPAAAERHARAFLAAHIDLLAPGAAPADFVLVSNVARRGLRVVGFRQTHRGMRVLGGQVSFRYKNDRMFAIGSEALPDVRVEPAALSAPQEAARGFARSWVLADAAAEADAGAVTGPFILPLVGRGGVLAYRVVHRVDVAARAPIGRYAVYTDAITGAPVAREQQLRFADGNVRFNVPVRHPGGDRDSFPARRGAFSVDGDPTQSNDAGQVSWSGTSAGALVARASGPLVDVVNVSGADVQRTFTIQPGGTVTWNASGDEAIEAQLNAFIHARIVKDYAREHYAPDLEWLDQQLPVNVNIDDSCNAFSDGESINFFQANSQCANTGQLADVVYHEFGHALHTHSIVEGVGGFDGAHSEGLADFLAASITDDPGMGRGFFFDEGPLRHIDPPDMEHVWPRDVGEIHFTGLIFAGAMWDLRELLIQQLGRARGVDLANRLFYATLERATSIPTTYVEILVEDDDDGDLSNGTPNVCDINAAFGMHGLRAVAAELTPLAAEIPDADGFPVTLSVGGLFAQCPGDGLAGANLEWVLRGAALDDAETIEMTEADDGTWHATMPPAEAGQVVRYKVIVDFQDGTFKSFPDNPADPRFEFYVGEVVPLYCTEFDSDPFAEGWTHGLTGGVDEEGADDWTWGPLMSPPSSGDPAAPFSGDAVLGNDLGGGDFNGTYQPDKVNFAQAPQVSVGQYSDVRVQYWRWLGVEDAFFDQATIYANSQEAWRNFDSEQGDQSAIQHTDREWRFHDVPVSDFISDGKLDVMFEIASDGGLEFGGWTIDDYCVVAAAGSICGDGVITGAETCDTGDSNDNQEPDACRANCRIAHCGDGVVDSNETCDDGNTSDGDGCNATCSDGSDGGDCGCQVAPRRGLPGAGSLLLLLALSGLVLFAPRWAARRRRAHM
jgi:cysteine-rich repeat protein